MAHKKKGELVNLIKLHKPTQEIMTILTMIIDDNRVSKFPVRSNEQAAFFAILHYGECKSVRMQKVAQKMKDEAGKVI